MATRYSLQQIPQLQGRKIFFDANILLYIFWPTGYYRWEDSYSSAFGNLLRSNNELVVDFIVISEVVNRAIRIEYEKYLNARNIEKKDLPFKTFRDGKEGKDAFFDIFLIVKESILQTFSVRGKSFSKEEIISFLQVDSLDLMDKAIIPICKENDCILLTNDKDFSDSEIDILSSNPAVFKHH